MAAESLAANEADELLACLPAGPCGLRLKKGTAHQIIERLSIPDSQGHRALIGYHLKNALWDRPTHLGWKKLQQVVGADRAGRRGRTIRSTMLIGVLQRAFSEMRVNPYNKKEKRARTVRKDAELVYSGVPSSILDLLAEDQTGEATYHDSDLKQKVDFTTLRPCSPGRKKPGTQPEVDGTSESEQPPPSRVETVRGSLFELLQSQPTNTLNGLLKKRAPLLRQATRSYAESKVRLAGLKVADLERRVQDTTPKQRDRYQRQLDKARRRLTGTINHGRTLRLTVEAMINEGLDFSTHAVDGSYRQYDDGPSLTRLPKKVREVLLDGFIELDLVAAHLTIFARLTNCTEYLAHVDRDGIDSLWASMVTHVFDRASDGEKYAGCKAVVKQGILSAVFGGGSRLLKSGMNRVADENEVRHLSSAGSLKRRLFEGHPIAAAILAKRETVLQDLADQSAKDGILRMPDCFGEYVDAGSFGEGEAGDIGHKTRLKMARSLIAKVISSYEIVIISEVVHSLADLREAGTMVYMFDGIYVKPTKADRGRKLIIETALRAADDILMQFGIPTRLKAGMTGATTTRPAPEGQQTHTAQPPTGKRVGALGARSQEPPARQERRPFNVTRAISPKRGKLATAIRHKLNGLCQVRAYKTKVSGSGRGWRTPFGASVRRLRRAVLPHKRRLRNPVGSTSLGR